MAGIRRFMKNTNIKTKAISVLLTVTILTGSIIWFGNNNMDNVSAEGSEKEYMEYIVDRIAAGLQEDFRVLEIVPYTGQGEFRYYLGDKAVENGLEGNQDLLKSWYSSLQGGNTYNETTGEWSRQNTWQNISINFSNFGYEMRYNAYTQKFEVRSPELFLNEVLPDYSGILEGRVHLDTVEANNLTEELIKKADLIVISTGTHDNNTIKCYESYSGITDNPFYTQSGAVTDSSDYDTFEKVKADDGTISYVSRDASWEMVSHLLDYVIFGRDLELSDGTVINNLKTPVILDNKEAGYLDKDGNMYKFGLIYRMLAADRYEDIKPYLSTTYTTDDGTVTEYINSKGIVTVALDKTATGTFDEDTVTSWGAGSNGDVNPIIKFFENMGEDGYSEYYDGNPFSPEYLTDDYWIYSGDSVLIPVNVHDVKYMSTKPGFPSRTGSETSTQGILQYLLGAKPTQIQKYDYTMKVLEVQPCNSFEYDTFDEVLALGKKMLMSGTDSWTADNYENYLEVDCVTTNALNGMTDDLLAEYDMIIIGENIDLLTKNSDGRTIYNDRKLNGYVYLAYGDLFKVGSAYLGILPSEYVKLNYGTSGLVALNESTKYLWSDYVYDELMAAGGNGKVFVHKNMYEYYKAGGAYSEWYYDNSTGELYLNYELGNARGADNDITDITKEKLKKFAESGKIVALADSLYEVDGTSIYPTSDMFDLSETLATKDATGKRMYSVIRQKRINAVVMYLANVVPEITMLEAPASPEYVNGVITTFGNRQMTYRFTLSGQVNKTYKVNLYVDKNSDGVFKGLEAGISDDSNELYYSEKVVLAGGNTTEYTINSRLSDNFVGMLSWKIEVIQLDDAGNETPYATSKKGYSAIKNETMKDIRVLQILPQWGLNLDLSYDNPSQSNDFQDLLNAVESQVGYNIIVDTMKADEYESMFKPNASGDNSYTKGVDINTEKDKLKSYDMVVIGFADIYGADDISNDYGALDNIVDFMDIGKAVLFTHDTLSWRTSPNYTTASPNGNNKIELWNTYKIDAYGNAKENNNGDFAFAITNALRDRVGLDKYGVTLSVDNRDGKEVPLYSGASMAPKYTNASADGKYYVSEIQGYSAWNVYRGSFIKTFTTGYDSPGIGLYSLMPYTNTEFFNDADELWTTTKVAQLNEGPVTMYPYAIDEKLTVAETHAQYYELNMEDEDIVVWYTLSDDGTEGAGYYECTEKDAGNNYYIYSKNNITYSGAGHSNMSSEMELRLFVNTIVKAIAGGNNEPEIMVTNGAVGAGGIYMVYTNSANSASDYQLDIKAIDADLISYEAANGNLSLVGNFKEAYVYWVKDDGTEVLIKSYTQSDPLKNGIVDELCLGDTSLTSAQLAQIETLVEDTDGGYAEFRIEVSDWVGARDSVTARIVERDLFSLE